MRKSTDFYKLDFTTQEKPTPPGTLMTLRLRRGIRTTAPEKVLSPIDMNIDFGMKRLSLQESTQIQDVKTITTPKKDSQASTSGLNSLLDLQEKYKQLQSDLHTERRKLQKQRQVVHISLNVDRFSSLQFGKIQGGS